MTYLHDDTESIKLKLHKAVCEEITADHFELVWTENADTIYWVYENEKTSYLFSKYHADLLEWFHQKYDHLDHSELLRVMWLKMWWHNMN